MSIDRCTALRCCCLLLFAVAMPALAAEPPSSSSPMKASLVKTGLYLIEGGGANTLMRFTATGLILIDGKSPGMYRDLMSQVRSINKMSDLPVRALILTSERDDRSGNIARFATARVPIV